MLTPSLAPRVSKVRGLWIVAVVLLASASLAWRPRVPTPQFEREFNYTSFFKGNTHAHSTQSDGLDSLGDILNWYRSADYNFLVVSEHNRVVRKFKEPGGRRVSIARFNTDQFIAVRGEEISYYAPPRVEFGDQGTGEVETTGSDDQEDKVELAPDKLGHHLISTQVHVNGLCLDESIPGRRFKSVPRALSDAIRRIRKQPGAIAQINHPNYTWALTADVMAQYGARASLIEIANQHPLVRNAGDADHPSVESKWDDLLSQGVRVYGVASDDVHSLKDPQDGRGAGKGWVQVAAPILTQASLCKALKAGAFYSSTGVTLSRIQVQGGAYLVEAGGSFDHVIEFIGKSGKVLQSQHASLAQYTLAGDEGYVRARVTRTSDGAKAWTQPVWVKTASP